MMIFVIVDQISKSVLRIMIVYAIIALNIIMVNNDANDKIIEKEW